MELTPQKSRQKRGRKAKTNYMAQALGLSIGLIGLALLYWVPVTVLTCRYVETSQVDCLIKQRLLGLIPVGEIPISHLERAYVERGTQTSRRSSDDREYTYSVSKVVLVSPSGEISLNDAADPDITIGNSERIVQKINDYLASPSPEPLTVWQAIWLPLVAGSCFFSILVLWVVGATIQLGILVKRSWAR